MRQHSKLNLCMHLLFTLIMSPLFRNHSLYVIILSKSMKKKLLKNKYMYIMNFGDTENYVQ